MKEKPTVGSKAFAPRVDPIGLPRASVRNRPRIGAEGTPGRNPVRSSAPSTGIGDTVSRKMDGPFGSFSFAEGNAKIGTGGK